MSEVFDGAGLPNGVVNLVHGLGERAGKALTEHPAIRAIALVCESLTGSHIMALGTAALKRVHFGLGGKNLVIVFDDADLDRARDAILLQPQRPALHLVEPRAGAAFDLRQVYRGTEPRIENIKIGHPLDPATKLGPLIHPRHAEKVLVYAGCARADGARIASGGGRALGGRGNYVHPMLFTGATSAMRRPGGDFGLALTVIPFDDEADALRIANDVRYGLAA